MKLTQTIKANSAFFIPYLLFLLAGGIVLTCFGKAEIHLYINKHHDTTFDFIFKYWTLIGLGWLIIPIVFVLCFFRLRYVIIAIAGFLLSAIVNDTIKQIAGSPRPAQYFGALHQSLYFVPGVVINHWNSFPSGHSATAFCLFCILALVVRSNISKLTCFIIALLIAYSRMYLSEHFLEDVYAGSIVGVLSALAAYSFGMNMKWLNRFPAMDKPVLKI